MSRIRIHTSDGWVRIREAQKQVDPVDPEHCKGAFKFYLVGGGGPSAYCYFTHQQFGSKLYYGFSYRLVSYMPLTIELKHK